MRKNHYKIVRIPKGEDTPCKDCDVYLDNGTCTGNCKLINRWKFIPQTYTLPSGNVLEYHIIKGYIYKIRQKYYNKKREI